MADVKYECTKCGKVVYIPESQAKVMGWTTGTYLDGSCRDGNSHLFTPRN